MALYKPHGLAVMGTRAHYDDNLSSYVMNYFHKSGLKSTVHLINRLDKDTAGIVLIAKSSYIHHLFQSIKLEKRYYALVYGRPLGNIIDEPIKRDVGIKRMVDIDGKCGGYNLQWAWSSGYIAGKNAVKREEINNNHAKN